MYSTIRTEETMSAAHMVHTDKDSPCYRIHGHNWRAIVEIEGDVEDDGMVIDYKDVKSFLRQYDHKIWFPTPEKQAERGCTKLDGMRNFFLQFAVHDIEMIDVPVITSEHMSRFFAEGILKMIKHAGYVKVTLYESEKSYAEYTARVKIGE